MLFASDVICGKLFINLIIFWVSKRDDKLLAEHSSKLVSANEVDGDDGSEEVEEDSWMGKLDVENPGGLPE